MSIEFTIRKGTTNPTSGSGITLGEPAFNYSNNTLWIGKGYGVTAAWVGAGICGASAGIAAGLTYQIPTLGAVKDYISSIGTIGATGAQGNTGATGPVGDYVISFNGITGAVTGITAGGANTFTALQTFSAGISAAGGVTFSADITVNSHQIGRGAGNFDTNIAIGRLALSSGSTGTNVTAVGVQAADQNSGTNVLAFGYQAAYSNDSNNLVSIGAGSGTNNIGEQNIFVGGNAGSSNNAGGVIAIGYNAATSNSGANIVAIGSAAGGAGSGTLLVAVGSNAGYGNAGYGSVAIGGYAMLSSCSGNRNTAIGSNAMDAASSAANNTSIGAHSLTELTTGSGTVAVGGYAGQILTTGSNNCIIGFEADVGATADSNSIVIGKGAVGLGTNTTVIGNSSTTSTKLFGILNLPSGLSAAGATFSSNIFAPNIVNSFNGNTGEVVFSSYVTSFNGSTGAISFANYAASVNGLTGAIVGVGFTSGKLSQFASTLSSELAGIISDETGSGVLVFGTSPSITTSLNTVSTSFNLLTTNATTLSIGSAATTGRLFGYTGVLANTQSVTIAGANTDTSVNKTVSIGTGSGTNGSVVINVGQTPTEGSGAINLLSNTAVTGTLSTTGNITAPNIVTSFNGITGAVTGVTAGGANTFTQLNSFSAGISAAGGATFSGTFSGTTGAFSKLLTLSGGLSASGATFSGSIALQNAEYIRNTTNGRVDIMPAPAAATAYGMYFDMTSWTYGVILGTIRSSDGAINTGGNFRVDVPLTINDNTLFQMGSDGHYGLYRSTTGLDTLQIKATINNAADSGAVAVVGGNDLGAANRSPGISHSNPNLYVYRAGSASANDFIRTEHNGTNANIVSGGTSGILIQPGSGILGISGGVSAGSGTFSTTISVTNGINLGGALYSINGGNNYISLSDGTVRIGDPLGNDSGQYIHYDQGENTLYGNGSNLSFQAGVFSSVVISGDYAVIGAGGGLVDSVSYTLGTTAADQPISQSLESASYRSAEFFVQASTAGGAYEALKIMVVHNGTTTYNTQYGVIRSGATLGTYTTILATAGGANRIKLRVTPTAVDTTYKVMITALPV